MVEAEGLTKRYIETEALAGMDFSGSPRIPSGVG